MKQCKCIYITLRVCKSSIYIMQDNALFSGKVHSWRKFTQPPVATAVTNQNSGQQMSPVFAFDKAAVAQKVNVQCCYRGPV